MTGNPDALVNVLKFAMGVVADSDLTQEQVECMTIAEFTKVTGELMGAACVKRLQADIDEQTAEAEAHNAKIQADMQKAYGEMTPKQQAWVDSLPE